MHTRLSSRHRHPRVCLQQHLTHSSWATNSLIISNTDPAIGGKAMRPVAINVDVGLGYGTVADEQPQPKDRFSEGIKHSVDHDLCVNTRLTSAASNTPNTASSVSKYQHTINALRHSHRIQRPQDEREQRQRAKQLPHPSPLGSNHAGPVQRDMPHDEQIRNARDGIPPPLLRRTRLTKRREQTGQNHNDIRHNCHERMRAANAADQAQVEDQQRRGQSPIDIARPVDLATHVVECVREMLMFVADSDAIERGGVARGLGKV